MILVIGLSPAWQRTLTFVRFAPGEVNRAIRVVEAAAGKGVNVARVATQLGTPVCLLTLAGGLRGRLLRKALAVDGIRARFIPVERETRLCQTLIAGHQVTELVEESPPLSASEIRTIRSTYSKLLARASLVVLSGSVPAGCGDEFFARLARDAGRKNVPVIVDTQPRQLLHVARERPVLIKINRAELESATGCPDVQEGVRSLMQLGARQVVISNGSQPTLVFDGSAPLEITPPRIKPVNPIGSGDAMLAGIVAGLWQGQSLMAAVKLGVACGASNARLEPAGVIRLADIPARLLVPRNNG